MPLRIRALLGGALLAVGLLTWTPVPAGVWNDDGVYLVIAQSLAAGEGLRYGGVPGGPAASKFPPVWPALVALVGGATPDHGGRLVFVNLALLALAGTLLAAWLSDHLGIPPVRAALLALLASLPGPLWTVAAIPLSEPLFLVAVLLALGAAARVERGDGLRAEATLLAALGLAFYTRTVGAVLPLAVVLALLLRRRPAPALRVGLGSVLLALPWILWSGAATRALDPGLRDTLGSYGSWWIGQIRTEPAAYRAWLGQNLEAVVRDATALLLPGVEGAAGLLLAVPVWGAVVVGLIRIGRASRTVPLALLGSLTLVWLWPFQSARLLTPWAPLLMAALLLGAGRMLRAGRAAPAALGGAMAGVVVLAALLHAWALGTGRPWRGLEQRAEALARAVASVEAHVPPDGVVGAPEMWAALRVHTGRRAAPSARFLPLQTRAPSWGSPAQQVALWRATGIDHVLLEHAGGVHAETLTRLEERCPGAVHILDTQPGMLLVRVGLDEACLRRWDSAAPPS
ncbi:MAG: hypothetical protein R3E98_03195 [Gemmatimonadota bacterium]